MNVYVKTQAKLDAIPRDAKDIIIYIDFGTKKKPAIVRGQYYYPVRIINDSVVATYDNSKVWARDNSIVYAHDNSVVAAYNNSKAYAYNNSNIYAHDDSDIYAYDNSEAIVLGNSNIYAYDNSKVCARNDKCIVSINDNAVVINSSIFCSGAELLNQCNGYIGDIKFTVSNVPNDNKDYVFGNFCYAGNFSKRAFVLTMQNTPYYCIYNPDIMSVEFYTMDFCCAFKNIADNTVFTHYLDNVLMPALVNTEFDKSAKLNII